MLAERRRARILEAVRDGHAVAVRDLCRLLGVSDRTVRRDLEVLERFRLLRRTHGGAVATATVDDSRIPLEERYGLASAEKERIARVAVSLLNPNDRVILDAGSTTYQVALQIPRDLPLVVITHAINVVTALLDLPLVEVSVCGGALRRSNRSLIGPDTVKAYENVRADIAFLGATGVTPELDFVNTNRMEGEVKRAILRAARRSIILVDHTKFGKLALTPFASVSHGISGVITDRRTPEDYVRRLRDAGIWVRVV